jgi:protease I
MAKIAIPLADGFEDSEFSVPYERLREAGHEVTVFGTRAGETVTGKRGEASHRLEAAAAGLVPEDFDALLIPGGHSPDRLRTDPGVVDFTRRFLASGRPVAAICHGPQLLIETGLVGGRTLTSWPSVRTDLINAGAEWVDREVVSDGNLITSRKPDDLPAFCAALLARLP